MIDERLSAREAASAFHATLVAALGEWIGEATARGGFTRVALGGGCLMNRILCNGLSARLRARGLEVAVPRVVPANDGGLSFGQAAFALSGLV
jgi:hydrogenase maturation protein HypF